MPILLPIQPSLEAWLGDRLENSQRRSQIMVRSGLLSRGGIHFQPNFLISLEPAPYISIFPSISSVFSQRCLHFSIRQPM